MTTILLFACAFALSGVAAFYSIAGLIAIFAGAPIPIAIMGSTLEASKLVVASWLYRNWMEVPRLLKGYLTCSLVILMMLTSMGIFGYLSKAHLEHGVPTADVSLKVEVIDQQIAVEKETINASRKSLQQLDEQVNQTISRTSTQTNDNGIARSITVRKAQTKERAELNDQIQQSQNKIADLNQQRLPIVADLKKVEAEVGPIKYIAALMYGDQPQTNVLEKAVRWVTLLIVVVFDPLAVMLLIAANWSLTHIRQLPEQSTVEDSAIEQRISEQHVEVAPEIKSELQEDPPPTIEPVPESNTTWSVEAPPSPAPENTSSTTADSHRFWRSRPRT